METLSSSDVQYLLPGAISQWPQILVRLCLMSKTIMSQNNLWEGKLQESALLIITHPEIRCGQLYDIEMAFFRFSEGAETLFL